MNVAGCSGWSSGLIQAEGVGVHLVDCSSSLTTSSMVMRQLRESLWPWAITLTNTAGGRRRDVIRPRQGRVIDALRLSIDVQVVDRRHRAWRPEYLKHHMLGVERSGVTGEAGASLRAVVRAEDAVQPIHAKPRDRDHRHGDQQHPPSSDQAANRNPIHPLAFSMSGGTSAWARPTFSELGSTAKQYGTGPVRTKHDAVPIHTRWPDVVNRLTRWAG